MEYTTKKIGKILIEIGYVIFPFGCICGICHLLNLSFDFYP